MEPVFASISSFLGLTATFLQERRASKQHVAQATIEEYIEWLRRREHAQVVEILESNHNLVSALKGILGSSHEEVISRFDRLEILLHQLLGPTAEWSQLVKSFDSSPNISDQAIDILIWFDTTKTSEALGGQLLRETFLCSNDSGGRYVPQDPRFFEDDLDTLVKLDLLTLRHGPKGSPIYRFTRVADRIVQQLRDDQNA